jgi:hypothetical protein
MAASDLFFFVSHVAEDRAPALEVVDELERRGVRCWIAPRDVHPGRPFDDEIVDAIEASRAMLLIFSEHCNESDYIRREVTVAGESHKLIIPFRIEDVPPRRGLRVRLSDLHWIDGFVSREHAVDQVIHTVDPDGIAQQQRERQRQDDERRAREEEERRAEAALRAEEEERSRLAEAARVAEARRQTEEAARQAEAEAVRQIEEGRRHAEQKPPAVAAESGPSKVAAGEDRTGLPAEPAHPMPRPSSQPDQPRALDKRRRLLLGIAIAAAIPVALIIMFWQSIPFAEKPSTQTPLHPPSQAAPNTAKATSVTYRGSLSGAAEVPPVSTAGTGSAGLVADPATKQVSWTITYSGLSGPPAAAHIHCGAAAGANAGVALSLGPWLASPIIGVGTLTDAQFAELTAGRCYVNIHTAVNKAGEVRAQLLP